MITFNQAPFIRQAVEGVLGQDFDEEFELLIGDDCSTDGTRDILGDLVRDHQKRVRFIEGPTNVGMNENLRRVALACRGKFIAFCEGDDVWHYPRKLAEQLALIRSRPETGMVYSDYDRAIQILGRWRVLSRVLASSGGKVAQGDAFEDLLDGVQVHLSTMLCREDLVREYFQGHLYDASLAIGDVPLLLYCAARARVAFLPISTSVYRSTPGSATNVSRRNLLRIVSDHASTVRRYEEHFGSIPVRRKARERQLDAMIAKLAYSAGDRKTHVLFSSMDRRDRLRSILMRVPFLHRGYMHWVSAKQMFLFWKASSAAPWLR
jgi:glycosyltransferase involved in cell wall biosynthesis